MLVDKVDVWADEAARLYAQAVGGAVGSGDRDPLGRAVRAPRRDRGRGRPGHDVSDRERDGGAARAEPLPRAAASALSRGDAAARDPGRRRGAAHRGVHAARAPQTRRSSGCRRPAARRRSRRCSTSPTSRSRPSCCRCSARARSCRCSGSSSATRPIRSRGGRPARRAGRSAPRRVRPRASRPASRARARVSGRGSPMRSSAGTTRCATPPGSTPRCSTRCCCWPPGRGSTHALRRGSRRVVQLTRDMDEGRRKRLVRLGFAEHEAASSVGAAHAQLHVAGMV